MNPFKSVTGRRQFLIASMTSLISPALGRFGRALGYDTATASDMQINASSRAIKGCVIYYSATGSTAKAAIALHRGMRSVMGCDIFPIKRARPEEMAKYDVIAIGGPIWYNRETVNIDLFILDMPHMDDKLCVPFCTHGTGPNGFMYNIAKSIHKRGLTIIGWNDWYGSVFHVVHNPKPYYTDGHPDRTDLMEAEAFGKAMAERALKILSGQRDLIPEIPVGRQADTLWQHHQMERKDFDLSIFMGNGGQAGSGQPATAVVEAAGAREPEGMSSAREERGGGTGDGTGGTGHFPKIDLKKCVYPRCRSCMDVCMNNAIDLSLITVQAAMVDGSDVVVKNACLQCKYPTCRRACKYDAIIYKSPTSSHAIDMGKCAYPKCALCMDQCLMNCIYVSGNKLLFHNNCEGCDVCYCVCPTGAVTITNIADISPGPGNGKRPASAGEGPPAGTDGQSGQFNLADSGLSGLPDTDRMATGGSEGGLNISGIPMELINTTGGRVFRRLVRPEDIGKYYASVLEVRHRPILELQEDDWPLMKDRDGNVVPNDYT